MVVPVGGKTPTPRPGPSPTPPTSSKPAAKPGGTQGNPYGPGTAAGNAARNAASAGNRAAADAAQRPQFAVTNAELSPYTESTFLEGRDAFGLRRGAIVRTHRDASQKNSYIRDPKNRYTFRFLFNPETISFGNQSFAGVLPPSYKNTNDNLVPLFVGQETVSFSLLLDRTQEAYEQGLRTRGTLDDVETLYRVVNGDAGSAAGFLSLSAVEIHWGPSTQNGRPLPIFPCYITSIDVTHTQFTPRMCPIRTALQINAARLVGAAGAGTGLSGISLAGAS